LVEELRSVSGSAQRELTRRKGGKCSKYLGEIFRRKRELLFKVERNEKGGPETWGREGPTFPNSSLPRFLRVLGIKENSHKFIKKGYRLGMRACQRVKTRKRTKEMRGRGRVRFKKKRLVPTTGE